MICSLCYCEFVSGKGIKIFCDSKKYKFYFAFVTRHPLTSQYSSSGVIESLNDLYLDLKST